MGSIPGGIIALVVARVSPRSPVVKHSSLSGTARSMWFWLIAFRIRCRSGIPPDMGSVLAEPGLEG